MSIIHRGAAVAALTASLFVAGCGMIGGANGSCTSADAQAVITDLVRKEVEKKALRDLRRDDGSSIASIANLRASLALIELAIEDVRTSERKKERSKRGRRKRRGAPSTSGSQGPLSMWMWVRGPRRPPLDTLDPCERD